jgi:hypothetical protein
MLQIAAFRAATMHHSDLHLPESWPAHPAWSAEAGTSVEAQFATGPAQVAAAITERMMAWRCRSPGPALMRSRTKSRPARVPGGASVAPRDIGAEVWFTGARGREGTIGDLPARLRPRA